MKTCSINECDSAVLALGFCRKHYLRQYKHGSPYVTKTPQEYAKRGAEAANFKHGLWTHPLYKTWANMMRRCYSKSDHAYKNYGDRGVKVCERWHDVRNFVEDMGTRPDGYSLDRIDNNKGYSPENCRWATNTQQSRNRRNAILSFEKAEDIRSKRSAGAKRNELAKEFGVSLSTIKKVLSGAYWKPTIAGAMKK